MKNMIRYGMLSLSIIIASCSEVLNPNDFEIAPFPVVIGFLSPESAQTKIFLSKAAAFNEIVDSIGSHLLIKNALVTIKDDLNRSVHLQYDSLQKRYIIDSIVYPIRHNRTYFLEVTINKQVLSAVCTIPAKINPIVATFEQIGGAHFIKSTWLDQAQVPNFYRLKGFFEGLNRGNFPVAYEIMWNRNCQKRYSLLTDAFLDGKMMVSPLGNISNFACNGFNSVEVGDEVHLEVISSDEPYYNYYKSVFAATESSSLSDPVTIYTNIKNGEGIFAGFTSIKQKIIF
jgi:hypothetical protein